MFKHIQHNIDIPGWYILTDTNFTYDHDINQTKLSGFITVILYVYASRRLNVVDAFRRHLIINRGNYVSVLQDYLAHALNKINIHYPELNIDRYASCLYRTLSDLKRKRIIR